MIPASSRGHAVSLTFALLFVCSCSASRDDSLNTSNIKVADSSVPPDEDAETEPETLPLEDAGSVAIEPDSGEAGAPDADAELDTGLDAELDAEIAPDAIVSVEVADAGEAPDTTVITEVPTCGDGDLDPDEECDQGASNSDSVAGACRTNCRSPRCGDGVLDQGEACDQGGTNSDTEANACRVNCTQPRCGDNVIDQGEQCDSGEARSNTAAGACRMDCRTARCGDGVRDADEACDDGNTLDADACLNTCRSAACGDHAVGPDEECDDGNTTSGDGCQGTCRLPACGDRVVDSGEQCDDGNTSENDGCRSNCQTGCVGAQACSDGVFCNGEERCLNGICQPPASPVSLNDGIGCTVDTCDEAQDRVVHTPTNTLCTADAPMCSAASSTTSTATCDATQGCVTRRATQACNDTLSSCTLLGSGNYTLTTFTPACNSANTSCGPAVASARTCPATPASCSVGRVFTGITAATCNPNTETCGTRAPAVDDCTTRDKNSCATDNTSFTQVRGTCSTPNGCASTTTTAACPDPADACANARVRTFAPACNPTSGCVTAGTQTSDTACVPNPTSCGPAGPNQQLAVLKYTAACDPNNSSRCLDGGTPATPEYCQAQAPVCNSTAARVPFVTSYAPACNGASCVDGGVQQPAVNCEAPTETSCGPTGTRGAPQQTSHVPACDPNNGGRCLEGGTPVTIDCAASNPKCERDPNANQRAAVSTYTRACQGAICLSGGSESKTYCDEVKTTCSGNVATDYLDSCNGTTCATSTTTCAQQTLNVCNSKRSGYDIRRYTGTCIAGEGCGFSTASSITCDSGPPFCQTLPTTGAVQSCGGCVSNSDGVPGCRTRTNCTTCTRGCSDATGLCNIAIVLPGLPGGGVIGALGNVGF